VSGNMRLLEGDVEPDQTPIINELRDEVRHLRQDLALAKSETAAVKRDTARAVSELRRQLSPLYRALQAVFGELDAAGVEDTATTSADRAAGDPRKRAIWDSWKARLGPTCAKVIEALLLQPDMTNRQIAVAIGTGRIQTVYDAIAKMNKVSLLTKSGDRYSLKQL
jgi:hypothetical protein